jgi:hypothetical protein
MENNKHLANGLINGLKKIAGRLEQLQVDTALGKADVKDKIQEYRTQIKEFLRDAKLDTLNGTGAIGDIKADIHDLEVQAHLGEMEAKEFFDHQKNKVVQAITKVDDFLKKELA